MKKYFMLMVTIIMIFITLGAYIYESGFKVQQYKQPSISIESKRFGTIKKIVMTNRYMSNDNALIILSSRNTSQGEISSIYRIELDSFNYTLLTEFPSHKNLNSEILFNSPMNLNEIIAAYDKGIMKIKYDSDDPSSATVEQTEINGFDTATSIECKGSLLYTREKDNIIYSKKMDISGFSFNQNNNDGEINYYVKPVSVVNINTLNNTIAYLSQNGDEVDLFAIKDGVPAKHFGLPVIKNIVSAHEVEDSFGFVGMNIIKDTDRGNKLNLFMLRGIINNSFDGNYYSLDILPNNTDCFAAVPAFASITFNKDYSLIYTSYDANHKGVLKICSLNEKPKVIVQNENIFGPLSISQVYKKDSLSTYILFFTNENNSTRVKLCNEKGENIKDITDMIN